MDVRGLRRHGRAERERIAGEVVEGLRRTLGADLLGVAATGSFARGDDRAYSDLEMIVFARPRPEGEDAYLQRVVDGLLVEAEYTTRDAYLERFRSLPDDWYASGSEPLAPLHGAAFVDAVHREREAIRHPDAAFVRRAAHRFLDVQESFGKVLNALESGRTGSLSLLLADAAVHLLATLSFLNRRPFTTFAAFADEARAFPEKPPGLDALLDAVAAGGSGDPDRLRDLLLEVFSGMERMFEARGYALYDESLDPSLPNRRYSARDEESDRRRC